MSFLAPAALGGGNVMSAIGSLASGDSARAVGDYNQRVADQNANQAIAASQSNAAVIGQKLEATQGQAAANFGAGGVQMTGSPLAVMASSASAGELQKQLALYGGQLNANADRSQGALAAASGRAEQIAGQIKGTSTLLTAAGNAGVAATAGTSPAAG